MARYLPVTAWLCAWYAGVVVVVINVAATLVQYRQHYTVNMFANSLSIFSLRVNFTDAPYARSGWTGYDISWTWDLYLNAICSGAQSEDSDDSGFRDCHTDTGKTFNLLEEMLSVENAWYSAQTLYAAYENSELSTYYATRIESSAVFSSLPAPLTARQAVTEESAASITAVDTILAAASSTDTFGSTGTAEETFLTSSHSTSTTASQTYASVPTAIPTAASSHVAPVTLNFVSPFVFYVIGLLNSIMLWFTVPGTFHGARHHNFLNTCISASSFLALLIASASSTGTARSSIAQLSSKDSKPYVLYASISMKFLAVTWSATGAMFLATVLLAMEWTMERFTPVGEKISRHWKPAGMSWLKRTRGTMRVPRERPERLRPTETTGMGLFDLERARQRQLELNREPRVDHLSSVERWMNRVDSEHDATSVERPD